MLFAFINPSGPTNEPLEFPVLIGVVLIRVHCILPLHIDGAVQPVLGCA